MVELLLQYGSDATAKNAVGDSCVTMAQKSGNQEIVSILVKNGASIRPSTAKGLEPLAQRVSK